jgi:hypothetical protein
MSDDSSNQWFYARGTEQQGPVDVHTLRGLLAAGQVQPGDLVWRDGMPNWRPAGEVDELRPPPAPPPSATPNYQQHGERTIPYNNPVGYHAADPQTQQLQSQATTALVVGIISIVLSACICGPAGVGLGIWGWVTGSKVPPGYPFSGQGKAGMICGIVGVCLGALGTIFQLMFFLPRF